MNGLLKIILTLLLLVSIPANSVYTPVFNATTNGGVSWTGNALGLSGNRSSATQPGIFDSQGAFATVDTSLQFGSFPAGTTINWRLNSAAAYLDLPPGSQILHAELVWSGEYDGVRITVDDLNTPITFTTPDNVAHQIAPNPATAAEVDNPTNPASKYYVRSATVTNLISGVGFYTAGGVPSSLFFQSTPPNSGSGAGWTLQVAYSNPNMLTSNLILYVVAEVSSLIQSPIGFEITGFTAPSTSSINSRLFVSAVEGDTSKLPDRFLVGSTPQLSLINAISGSNNPLNNFFASQINTTLPLSVDPMSGKLVAFGASTLDTRGTFGTRNGDAGTALMTVGQRQGYDITSINISDRISPGQTSLYLSGTGDISEIYIINALALQLQVQSPTIRAVKTVFPSSVSVVNDTVTFRSTFTNVGGESAFNLSFIDQLPPGLAYVNNSLKVNGILFSNQNIAGGVPVGNLAPTESFLIEFQARVTAINPPTSYSNVASVNYALLSGGNVDQTAATNEVVVTTVLIPPPVANDDAYSTEANVILNSSTSLLANDTGTSITVTSFTPTQPGSSINVQPNGNFTYTPPPGFSGLDTFTYMITDAIGQTSEATVRITVRPSAQSDSGTTPANTPLNSSTSLLDNDIGTNLEVVSNTQPGSGTVVVSSNGLYTYTPNLNFSGLDSFNYTIVDGNNQQDTAAVSILVTPIAQDNEGTTFVNTPLNGSTLFANDVGTGIIMIAADSVSTEGGQVNVNMMTGNYTYTPAAGYSGRDSFQYTIQDQEGTQSTATVRLTVIPIAVDDVYQTVANTPLNGASVLTNDLGTNLSVTDYTTMTLQGGTVILDNLTGEFLYTPRNNFSGNDVFTYNIIGNDDIPSLIPASVRINVLPLAINDTAVTTINTPLIGTSVLVNDQGETLTIVGFQNPSNQQGSVSMNQDGTYLYTPPLNFSGEDIFTYQAQDSSGVIVEGQVTITVTPLAVPDNYTIPANTVLNGSSVLTNDLGSNLTITSFQSTTSKQGSVVMDVATGTFTYTPVDGFSGADAFIYTISDGVSSAQGIVTIVVTPIANPDNYMTLANTVLNGSSVLANDIGTNLIISSFQSTTVQQGTVVMNNVTGTFVYTPPNGFSGIDYFTYVATDGTSQVEGLVTIIVIPVANPDNYTTPENTPLNGSSVLNNDIGTGLTIVSFNPISTQGGSINMNVTGTFVYTPPQGFIGVDTFTYIARDLAGNEATGLVTINVTPAPPIPPRTPTPPINFVGEVDKNKFLNKTIYCLKSTWQASTSANVQFYRIYYKNKLIQEVSANAEFLFSTYVDSEKEASNYEISAVNRANLESRRIKITIQ